MTGPTYGDRPATTGSPRLAALALLIAGGAAVGLALHPGSALASTSDWTPTAAGPQTSSLALRAAAEADDAQSDGDDSGEFDDNAPDNDGLPSDGTDDDSGLDDGSGDGWKTNDGTEDPNDRDVEDGAAAGDGGKGGKKATDGPTKGGTPGSSKTSVTVVIDRRGRALKGPRTFAASRTARAGGLHWTGWSTGTATAKGRITVRHRKARVVRGAGTVTLTNLAACSGGKSVYRKATLSVAGRTVATVALPGCSKLR